MESANGRFIQFLFFAVFYHVTDNISYKSSVSMGQTPGIRTTI